MRSYLRNHPGLVAAAFALAMLLPPRLALCEGEDGHRALELLNAACCPSKIAAPGDHEREPVGCASECTDVPVNGSEALSSSAPTTDSPGGPPTTGYFAHSSSCVRESCALALARDRDGPPTTPPRLRAASLTVRRL